MPRRRLEPGVSRSVCGGQLFELRRDGALFKLHIIPRLGFGRRNVRSAPAILCR